MDIPKAHGNHQDSQTSSSTPTTAPTLQASAQTQPNPSPASPSALPPAALDLAAKLFDLARAGSTEPLTQYLSAGVPPNLTNGSGDTLLMLASYHGHTATAQMLLDAGADPNVLNERGQSPLAGAVFKGHEGVVRALFAAGASTALGTPSAVDAARMFRRARLCELFGVEMGEAGGEMPPGAIPGAPAMG